MAGRNTVKLFQFNLKYFHAIGIRPLQPNQNSSSFNSMNWVFFSSMGQQIAASMAFLVFEEKSIAECANAFNAIVTVCFVMAAYLTYIWQIESIMELIEFSENFIEKSELLKL